MKVVLFGASGMVGQGALRASLKDDGVESVVAVVRRPLGVDHPKLREVIHTDFTDFSEVRESFAGADACFFCLGISSAGQAEAEYARVTHDFALAAARALLPLNEDLTFVYVSGAGADSAGTTMWARVKGRTENALLAMPLRAYVLRPAYIQPRHGARSRTRAYRLMYGLTSWLYPVLSRLLPWHTTTTDALGRAMLALARREGRGPHVLSSSQINSMAGHTSGRRRSSADDPSSTGKGQ